LNAQKKIGVGLIGGYSLPIGNLSNWYSGIELFGGRIIFGSSVNNEYEVEYNYLNYSNSSMTERMFAYKSQKKYAYLTDEKGETIFISDNNGNYIPYSEVDKNKYPNAKGKFADSLYSSSGSSNMTINSITINSVAYIGRMDILKSRFFITGGLGFYIYKHHVDSLLYGGRPFKNGKKVFLEPFEDSRVALGFNFGGGVEFQISDDFSMDIRLRYNFIVGEIRPMEAYTYKGNGFASDDKRITPLEKVFPIQNINLSASIKYYIR